MVKDLNMNSMPMIKTTTVNHGGILSMLYDNYLVNSITRVFESFSESKKKFGLVCPGSFENLHKEARNVSLTHLLFEGGKLELAKMLSPNFQLNHSLSLGSSNIPPSYHFGTVFVGKKHFLQGMVDGKGDLQGKYHYSLTDKLTTKAQVQLSSRPGYSMFQLEGDYLGDDYSVNMKAINMNPIDSTGIYAASYLQSVTKALALGVEGVFQKPSPDMEEAGLTLVAKYAKNDYTLTVNLQNMVGVQASYFQKMSESVELCTELQALIAGPQTEALATIGCKMDYRQSSVRAQVDSVGKVALFLEERLFGRISFLVSGELDHLKGKSKFGVGLNVEN